MRPKVKICGITRFADAIAAIDAGAEALGFMFYEPSPRNLSFEAAAGITKELPPFVCRVGVFVDPTFETVNEAIERCHLDAVQLHGNESPKFCLSIRRPTVKAFRIQNEGSLAALSQYPVSAWLLDAYSPDKMGGSGETFNWKLAVAAQSYGRPIILAGGLTPSNIREAVRTVRPYGVDVSSGVESSPGIKDPAKMRDFIQAAHSTTGG